MANDEDRDYNPNSMNSVIARLFTRMDAQDALLKEIRDSQSDRWETMDTRMTAQERSQVVSDTRASMIGGVAAVVMTAVMWIADKLFTGKS